MKPSYTLLMLAGSALSLSGQQTFSGPARGYVFDDVERSIRAILGVPGAAYLGSQPGSLPQPAWDSVSVAPNGKRALGAIGLSVNLIPDLSHTASFTSLAQVSGPISKIAWSADSTTAAIWSSAPGQLRRITGLDSTPLVHDPIDLAALAGVLSGWSLSPDGRYLALSGSASVYLSDRDAAPVPIGSLADPGAVAFARDGTSVFVFNGAEHRIQKFDLPSGAVAGATVLGTWDASLFDSAKGTAVVEAGIRGSRLRRPSPAGVQDLAVSADGARLYAVGGDTLCGYDVSSGEMPSCSSLEMTPRSFQSMPGGLLLLNYRRARGMPLWLLDEKTGQTWFVPVGNATADASF